MLTDLSRGAQDVVGFSMKNVGLMACSVQHVVLKFAGFCPLVSPFKGENAGMLHTAMQYVNAAGHLSMQGTSAGDSILAILIPVL